MKKALVAMSGGVDSAVTAYMMKKDGFDCVGATMRLFNNVADDTVCGSLKDADDAKLVAEKIGIPHFVFDFKDDFKTQVIDRFISAYEEGFTPNPCIECNRYLKFEALYKRGLEMECDCIATGHYARIEKSGNGYILRKAVDSKKDQSYVLYSIKRKQLEFTRFPLGNLSKDQVREIAEDNGFLNARKKDSQDICFVPDGDYAKVIESYTGKTYPAGEFITKDGRVLGEHKGIIRYTIGQRKGLGLALPEPMYVCKKRMDTNQVVLGRNEDLFSREFDVSDINWLGFDNPPDSFKASVKVRYSQTEKEATVYVTGKNSAHIKFDEPQRAITCGQAAVIYDGDVVLGGGTIISIE